MVRKQIVIEPEQERALEERAKALGVSQSALIRQAIDAMLEEKGHNSSAIARARAALVAERKLDKRKCGPGVWWTGLFGTEPNGPRFMRACQARLEAKRTGGGGEPPRLE